MTRSESADLEIESIAAGGDGVARHEGMVVFVPRSAPGDRLVASIDRRKQFARGRIERLLVPSRHRVDPPCDHYTRDNCGGCQIQHIEYGAQLDIKRRIITDAMQRIGNRDVPGEIAMVASPAEWRYRRKLTLALRRQGTGWKAGLHPFDAPGRVFDLRDCPITDESVLSVWKEIMSASEHLPHALALRGAVRLTMGGGASLLIEGGAAWPNARRLFDRVSSLTALWWAPEGHRRRLLAERDRGGSRGTASFVQVNAGAAALVREHVIACALAHDPRSALDCYAGEGDTAAALSAAGCSVQAVELDRDAAARCAERLTPPSRAITGAVEEHLPGLLPADVVVLNPPRNGVEGAVTAALEESRPRAVVYASCNPATLARDVSRLPGFRIASIRGFDMFPQTSHVEVVCQLVREAA